MELLKSLLNKSSPRSSRHVQILSDLHLEVGQQYSSYDFPACAPLLLLAGDIGRLIDYDAYLGFLESQASRFSRVFLVLGNHEFYGLDYHSGLSEARRLTREKRLNDRVTLLHRSRWDDPHSQLTILGCTLWSAIPEEAYAIVTSKIGDYRNIQGWTADLHNEMHLQEVTWLREQVAQVTSEAGGGDKRRLLIATHHAPCVKGTSRPEHQKNPWTVAFATDLLTQKDWSGVSTWVFGHTHYTTSFRTNGVQVVANQRGYVFSRSPGPETKAGRLGVHDFDASRTITM